jgi:hypothetical protein
MNLLLSRRRIPRMLRGIECGLAGSDPQLARLFAMFTQRTRGEDMPGAEKLRAGPVRLLAQLRSAAGPGRPLEHWRTWLWISLFAAIVVAGPYALAIGGTGHCVARACAQPVEQHPHGDRRHAMGQAGQCLVYQNWHATPSACLP